MPQQLLKGLQHFRNTDLARYKQLYEELAHEGQHPRVLFIACSDSRIVPNLLTGTGPGDLFIVRTIGNIVGDLTGGSGVGEMEATAAAVEFSVASLGVTDVVLCGHSRCGAMKALYDGVPDALPYLRTWVEQARRAALPAAEAAELDVDERDRRTAERNVLLGLDRLAAHPLIAERRASKELILHGWYYDIATSDVHVFDPAHGDFREPEELLS
jgi:carbonic anhydrase